MEVVVLARARAHGLAMSVIEILAAVFLPALAVFGLVATIRPEVAWVRAVCASKPVAAFGRSRIGRFIESRLVPAPRNH